MKEEKKVYIGNLDYGLTEDELIAAVEEKGIKPTQLTIIKDKFTEKSKGFGFAEFETGEQAQQAVELLNDEDIKGRKIRVSMARKGKTQFENNGRFQRY